MDQPRLKSVASEKESARRKEPIMIIKRVQQKPGAPYLHERMKKQFEENEIRETKKTHLIQHTLQTKRFKDHFLREDI